MTPLIEILIAVAAACVCNVIIPLARTALNRLEEHLSSRNNLRVSGSRDLRRTQNGGIRKKQHRKHRR
jgi:hypothetical protein